MTNLKTYLKTAQKYVESGISMMKETLALLDNVENLIVGYSKDPIQLTIPFPEEEDEE